jgi:hypothetical protein
MTFRAFNSVARVLASLAVAVAIFAGSNAAADDDRFIDRRHGFSFSKPRFTPSEEKDVATVAVTLSGAPDGSFAPNVNVVVQNLETTLEDYQQAHLRQLKAIGWKVVEQSHRQIDGKPALQTRARGSLQGLDIEFVEVAVIRDGEKMFVLTCTATTEQFSGYEVEFERVISSFALEP